MKLRMLGVLLAILALTTIVFSCSRSSRTTSSSVSNRIDSAVLSQAGVEVEIIGADGLPDAKAAANHTLTVTPNTSGRSIEVALKKPITVNTSYLKITFDGSIEHPADYIFNEELSKKALVYAGSVDVGTVICAQVIPNNKSIDTSGNLIKIQLHNGADPFRVTSDFSKQKDATNRILAEAAVDTTDATKITFKIKLKGEANVNNLFDFADFGSVGLNYNRTKTTFPASEPADGNESGKVDFADFGIIGLNYNKGINGIKVYRDDSNPPTTNSTTISLSSKYTGDQTIDIKTVSQGSDGFRKYTIDPKGSGSNVQLVLVDSKGTEDKTYVSDVVSMAPPSKSISGTVKSQKSLPMADVTMTLRNLDKSTNQIQKTGADGSYKFSNLLVGTNYQLTPTKTGYSFSPTKYLFTGSDEVLTQDFIGILPISEADLNTLKIVFVKRPSDTTDPSTKTNCPVLISKRTSFDTDKTNDEPWTYPAVWIKAMGKTSTSPTKEVNVSKYVIFNLTNNSSFGRIDGYVDSQGLTEDEADDVMAISGVSAGDFEVTAMSDGLSKITTPLTVNSYTILNIALTGKDGTNDFKLAKTGSFQFTAIGTADNDGMFGDDPLDTTPPFKVLNIEPTIYWLLEGPNLPSFNLSNKGNLSTTGLAQTGEKVAVFASVPLPLIFGSWEFPITSNTIWVTIE